MKEERRYLDGKSRDVGNCLVFNGNNIIYKIILYLLTKNRVCVARASLLVLLIQERISCEETVKHMG
jgi:hypothetical protein